MIPLTDGMDSTSKRSTASPRKASRSWRQSRLQRARDGQSRRAALGVGARPGRDHGRRCRAGAPPSRDRRPGSRLRLPRLLGAQAVCPSGVGALWGRRELLEAMEPFNLGGHMIKGSVRGPPGAELPHKFEAGTSPIAEAVGFGAAVDYLNAIGLDAIEQHEHELVAPALEAAERRAGNPAVRPSPGRRAGSSASTWTASTRTTSLRCSTGRVLRSGRATTASR